MKTAEEIITEVFYTDYIDSEKPMRSVLNKDLHLIAMEEYAEQFKPKWISIHYRLPLLDEDGKSSDVYICGITYIDGQLIDEKIPTIGWMDEGNIWGNIYPERQKVIVTHWMPLPEPPKPK